MQPQGVLKVAWSTATDQLPRINALVKNEVVPLGSLGIFFLVSVCIFDDHHRQRGWIWMVGEGLCSRFCESHASACPSHKDYV